MKSVVKYIFLLIFTLFCYSQNNAEVIISPSPDADSFSVGLSEYNSSDHFNFNTSQQPINIERTEFSQKTRRCTNRTTHKILKINHADLVQSDCNTYKLSELEYTNGISLNSLSTSNSYKYILFRMLLI